MSVVCVDENGGVRLSEEVVELALRLHYALEAAEATEMRPSDVCDDAAVRLYNLHECLYLARMVGTHLYHGDVVRCVQAQQCQRHSDMVVEVALREEQAEFAAEDGGQ